MKRIIIMIMLGMLSNYGFSQKNDSASIRRIVNETLINGTAYENLRKLCKQVGHRLAGSPQYIKAAKMVASMFREMGVDTVYMQPVMVPRWIRGEKERGHIISGGKKSELRLLALGNSVGTGPKGIT